MVKKKLSKEMIFILSGLILAIAVFGVFIYREDYLKIDYTPTEYEKQLIEYFKEVALNAEYEDSPGRTIKWVKPMNLFISKDKEYELQTRFIEQTIANINKLVTNGFEIRMTKDASESNAILYLGTRARVAALDQDFYELIDEDFAGLAYVEFEWSNYTIPEAKIFISTEDSIEIQESTILEEITQSIGLLNDSEKYPTSIFYEHQFADGKNNKEYSKMDADIIRLLYHPKMKSGLNSRECERTIKKILKESH